MSDIWIEVRYDDSCMWQLKGKTWDEEPKLEVLQEIVDGYIEFVPDVYLGYKNVLKNIVQVYVLQMLRKHVRKTNVKEIHNLYTKHCFNKK